MPSPSDNPDQHDEQDVSLPQSFPFEEGVAKIVSNIRGLMETIGQRRDDPNSGVAGVGMAWRGEDGGDLVFLVQTAADVRMSAAEEAEIRELCGEQKVVFELIPEADSVDGAIRLPALSA